jgi:galactokinase
MDQFISILARREHALFLDCRARGDPPAYSFTHVPVPSDLAIVVVDSGVRHLNTGPLFNRRVAEGRIGVRLLQCSRPGATHLRDVLASEWGQVEPLLPDTVSSAALRAKGIDPDRILDDGRSPETDEFQVRRRCRHVVTENARVLESVAALEAGDKARFGLLLGEAHSSARDDYEISTPEIEALVSTASGIPGCYGARLTGAGWGGCIVAAVDASAVAVFVDRIAVGYRERTGRTATAFVCRSAHGAGLLLETRV